MSNYSIVIAVTSATIAILLGFILWRRNRKPAQQANGSQGPGVSLSQFLDFVRIGFAILSIAALAWFLWLLYNTNVTLAQASDWARGHWAFVVLAAIALGVIIAKTMKARATTLIWLLGAATLALLLAEPVGAWVSEISLPQVTCQDPSSQKALTCLLNTKDSSWMKPAEGVADDGMRICYTPSSLIEFEYRLVNGTSFYRFRAKEGHVLMTYRLHKIPPGEECRQV